MPGDTAWVELDGNAGNRKVEIRQMSWNISDPGTSRGS